MFEELPEGTTHYLTDIELNKLKRNIGLLRQWINEDRIDDPDKMITNEQIKNWLFGDL